MYQQKPKNDVVFMKRKLKKFVTFKLYDTEEDIGNHLDELRRNGTNYTNYIK